MPPASQPVLYKSARVLELDATRGAAMLAVILSHSANLLTPAHESLGTALVTIGLVATPTFLLLSGTVCGYLGTRDMTPTATFRSRLVDRGLFLLLVVHLLLGLTHAMWMPASSAIGGSFYITDAVAVGLIVAAFVGAYLRPSQLLLAGAVLLLCAWVVSAVVGGSHAQAYSVIQRLLIGIPDAGNQDEGWIVPLMPYLGLFLIGMAAGVKYTVLQTRPDSRETTSRFCIGVGIASATAAVAIKVGWLASKTSVPQAWHPLLYWLTEPRAKIPPGPAYVLAYGGAGLVLTGSIIRMASVIPGERLVRLFAIVGRSSLFVYVLQYWLILVPARGFRMQGGIAFWAFASAASVLATWMLAWCWDRSGSNRLLTLRPLLRVPVLLRDRKT